MLSLLSTFGVEDKNSQDPKILSLVSHLVPPIDSKGLACLKVVNATENTPLACFVNSFLHVIGQHTRHFLQQ